MPRRIQAGEAGVGSKVGPQTQRVTITLPAALAQELVEESVERNTTASAVVREAVTEYFARRQPEGLPEFVGMVEGDDPTLSERVEEILAQEFGRPRSDAE